MNKKKPFEKEKRLAKQAIEFLLKEAAKSKKHADEYVKSARRIAMKLKVRMPKELKRQYCKHCYAYFRMGDNCRVRVQRGKVIYYCFSCKKYTRIPYK